MAATELPLGTDPSAEFIFDASLSTAIAANGKTEVREMVPKGPLSPELLDRMNRYWLAPVEMHPSIHDWSSTISLRREDTSIGRK
jgi:hypothetical protein